MKKLYKSQLLGATIDLNCLNIFFWGGIFSQWAKSEFYDMDLDLTFNCAEQAMMYKKAMLFKDADAMATIHADKDPRNMKAIGRTIKNYDDALWTAHRYDIVRDINVLKFSQNTTFKDLLIMTDGFELVEASPEDKIWGVGLAENDPLIVDRTNWKGLNLLGQAITEARNKIIQAL
jgi:ribA/ribD-fused uncharacterized protein